MRIHTNTSTPFMPIEDGVYYMYMYMYIRAIAPPCRSLPECDKEPCQLIQLLYTVDHPHVRGTRERTELKTHSETVFLMKFHVLKES